MSFLTNARAAATVAKEAAVVARSRVHEVRATLDATPIVPVAPPPAEAASARRAADEAVAAGAVDPRTLITRAEAGEVAGVALGEAQLTYSDVSIGVRHAAEDRRGRVWTVEVSTWFGADGRDPDSCWAMLAPALELGEPVDGLGSPAVGVDALLYVRAADVVLQIEVGVPEEDAAARRDRALGAARIVLGRL